jgi:hypothetical protein
MSSPLKLCPIPVLIFYVGFSELTGFIGFSGWSKKGYEEDFLQKYQGVTEK